MANLRVVAIGHAMPFGTVGHREPRIVTLAGHVVIAGFDVGRPLERAGPVADSPDWHPIAGRLTTWRKIAVGVAVGVVAQIERSLASLGHVRHVALAATIVTDRLCPIATPEISVAGPAVGLNWFGLATVGTEKMQTRFVFRFP